MKYKIYDCHDITEILLKVALNTIPLTLKINKPKKSISNFPYKASFNSIVPITSRYYLQEYIMLQKRYKN
jgi:hypothetical protein